MQRAVALLSGGIDSSTATALARHQGYEVYAISFDYGQRHQRELEAARAVGKSLGVKDHRIVRFDLRQWGGSALTDDLTLPLDRPLDEISVGIPITYVPARNTIFLAFALSYAEASGCDTLFFGANQLDYSGYPDCRSEYLQAFERMANLATKVAVEGQVRFHIEAPLLNLRKSEIIRRGLDLGVDYALTWSCYQGRPQACGRCDSCLLRLKGFEELGIEDPIEYETIVAKAS